MPTYKERVTSLNRLAAQCAREKKFRPTVSVWVVLNGSHLVLVESSSAQKRRDKTEKYFCKPPQGGVEKKEGYSVIAAAGRELEEETGIRVPRKRVSLMRSDEVHYINVERDKESREDIRKKGFACGKCYIPVLVRLKGKQAPKPEAQAGHSENVYVVSSFKEWEKYTAGNRAEHRRWLNRCLKRTGLPKVWKKSGAK